MSPLREQGAQLRSGNDTWSQIQEIRTLLPAGKLDSVVAALPAMKRPTVNPLYGSDDFEVTTVADKCSVNTLIPALKAAGAEDILEIPISKIVR